MRLTDANVTRLVRRAERGASWTVTGDDVRALGRALLRTRKRLARANEDLRQATCVLADALAECNPEGKTLVEQHAGGDCPVTVAARWLAEHGARR